jgi:hypothetical protein
VSVISPKLLKEDLFIILKDLKEKNRVLDLFSPYFSFKNILILVKNQKLNQINGSLIVKISSILNLWSHLVNRIWNPKYLNLLRE